MKTETKHTPGPWEASYHGTSLIVVAKAGGWITGQIGQPERDANARLIAAAPALLEALRLALGQMEGSKPLSGVHSSSLKADIEIARSAIAKATGGGE